MVLPPPLPDAVEVIVILWAPASVSMSMFGPATKVIVSSNPDAITVSLFATAIDLNTSADIDESIVISSPVIVVVTLFPPVIVNASVELFAVVVPVSAFIVSHKSCVVPPPPPPPPVFVIVIVFPDLDVSQPVPPAKISSSRTLVASADPPESAVILTYTPAGTSVDFATLSHSPLLLVAEKYNSLLATPTQPGYVPASIALSNPLFKLKLFLNFKL